MHCKLDLNVMCWKISIPSGAAVLDWKLMKRVCSRSKHHSDHTKRFCVAMTVFFIVNICSYSRFRYVNHSEIKHSGGEMTARSTKYYFNTSLSAPVVMCYLYSYCYSLFVLTIDNGMLVSRLVNWTEWKTSIKAYLE